MKDKILKTDNDYTGLIIRLTLGIVMFPHGAQKMLGWYGGPGFQAELGHLQEMEIPWLVAVMVILIEFFGAISLIIGLVSRLWAIAFGGLFIGIIFMEHFQYGFFMNWFGNQEGEGYEYHLLVIGLCLALWVQGSGRFSIDSFLLQKKNNTNSKLLSKKY